MTRFQTTKTAVSVRERRISEKPSARSRQCPRLTASALWSNRAGIRAMKAAEKRKLTALTQ